MAKPPPVRPTGVGGNPPSARVGPYGAPGSLLARIETAHDGDVIYRVTAIILVGPSPTLADARAAHRYMLWSAATLARRAGRATFTFYGEQANPNFRAHADRLAAQVGVPNSGRIPRAMTGGHPDYAVTLDAVKVLA